MRTLLLALLVAGSAAAQPAGPDSLARHYNADTNAASALYRNGHHAASADRYARAFGHVAAPAAGDLYNAACSAALAGQTGRAFGFLHRAIEAGWDNVAHMDTDPDLEALRAYPELWAEVHAAIPRALAARYPDFDADLAATLAEVYASDQGIRRELRGLEELHGFPMPDSVRVPFRARWARVDSLNLARVAAVLEAEGWPGRSRVGRQGASAVFLVVQHAPHEVQERYLPLMREAVAQDEAEPSALALLEDRVRVGNDRPQLYGSQVWQDAETGAMVFFPIEDPDGVDARRAEMGLEPLSEYGEHFGLEWPSEMRWRDGE